MVIGSVQRYCMRTCRWSCRSVADARHVGDHAMPCSSQQRARADARELQQLRRVERAAGEDDLAAGARDCESRRRGGIRRRRRARPSNRTRVASASVTTRGWAAGAPAADSRARSHQRRPFRDGELEIAGALLRRAVEIVVARECPPARAAAMKARTAVRLASRRTPRAARRRRAARPRRAPGPRSGGNRAARRRSPSRHCRAGANGRNPRAGRGCRAAR